MGIRFEGLAVAEGGAGAFDAGAAGAGDVGALVLASLFGADGADGAGALVVACDGLLVVDLGIEAAFRVGAGRAGAGLFESVFLTTVLGGFVGSTVALGFLTLLFFFASATGAEAVAGLAAFFLVLVLADFLSVCAIVVAAGVFDLVFVTGAVA